MTFQKSEFKLISRDYKETIVLIPGWAFDYRIFNCLSINYNYIVPIKFSPYCFVNVLSDFLNKNKLDKVSIFGWSMGVFVAGDFIVRYPEKIQKIIFISAKEKYNKEGLEEITAYLRKSKKAYLYKFYKECFSESENKKYDWFKRNFLKGYLKDMKLHSLLEGLNYLSDAKMEYNRLRDFKIKFIHGKEDRIVPLKEVLKIKNNLPDAEYIFMDGAGHLPFRIL